MGCCQAPEEPPRMDVPLQGPKHAFKISAEGMLSSNFTVYDNTTTAEKPNCAPWLRLVHSGNLDNDEGTIDLEMKAKGDDDRPLLKAEVGRIEFQELDSSTTEEFSWFDSGSDEKTRLAWSAERVAKVMADGDQAAVVSIKYLGVACCRKDVDYEMEGDGSVDREVRWEKWAQTKEVNITLELAGEQVTLNHSLGADKGSDGNWDQKYNVEGNFDAQYISNWGTDEIVIDTEEGAQPLVACTMGFLIAYWLHPKRVENNTMEKAERILRQRQGFFDCDQGEGLFN